VPFLDPLATSDQGRGNYKVLREFRYLVPDGTQTIIKITAGYTTHFPEWLVPFLYDDSTLKPGVVHNWDYTRRHCIRTRGKVDRIFLTSMIHMGVHPVKAYLLWGMCRVVGWVHWR
jgi:hypothetical protein